MNPTICRELRAVLWRDLGWNPASNSEAGGMYFRREGRILEGEDTGGTPLKERSIYAGVMITVHFALVFYGTLTSVC